MLSEPPDADPHVRWCGGRRGEPGAYPILLELGARYEREVARLGERLGRLEEQARQSSRTGSKPQS